MNPVSQTGNEVIVSIILHQRNDYNSHNSTSSDFEGALPTYEVNYLQFFSFGHPYIRGLVIARTDNHEVFAFYTNLLSIVCFSRVI